MKIFSTKLLGLFRLPKRLNLITIIGITTLIILIAILLFHSSIFQNIQTKQTPATDESNLSLGDAFAKNLVTGSFLSNGKLSGDNIILTIKRTVDRPISLVIQPGTILKSKQSDQPSMVVCRMGSIMPSTQAILLNDNNWHEVTIEAYSIEFKKPQIQPNTEYTWVGVIPSETLIILQAADKAHGATTDLIQAAVWVISDGVNMDDLKVRGYTPSLDMLKTLFSIAKIDQDHKRIFDTSQITTDQGYVTRANRFYQLGEYAQAIADFSQALKMNPQASQTYYQRGFAYLQMQNFDAAQSDFTKFVSQNPQNPFGYYAVGLVNSSKAHPDQDQAITNLKKAIQLKPDFTDAYYTLGMTYVSTKAYDLAINQFNQVIKLDPSQANAYFARGEVWGVQQEYTKAIDDFSEAIRLNPNYANALERRGISYLAIKKKELAVQDLRKYLELSPTAADRKDVENLISTILGNKPTPAPGQTISLADALNNQWVKIEVRGVGVTSGDSLQLKIWRTIEQELSIQVPVGVLFSSQDSTQSDMVVRRLRGLAVGVKKLIPTDTIHLTDNAPQEYFLEAYSVDFNKGTPQSTTSFDIKGFVDPKILRIFTEIGDQSSAESTQLTQTAIWVVMDRLSQEDLAKNKVPVDLAKLKELLYKAGLIDECLAFSKSNSCSP